jgi:hypothetical protein
MVTECEGRETLMEMAFTILAMGAVDAVITGILKHIKHSDKIIFVRVGMYLTAALLTMQEVMKLFQHVRSVFGL